MEHLISADELVCLGPLGPLIGSWEGDKGTDLAPGRARDNATSLYREKTIFTSAGRVDNHEQILYGLKFATIAWRIGEDNSFHEEFGIWLWDAARRQIMRCFVVPRGISVIAGGDCDPTTRDIKVAAKIDSTTYGILSNQFLDVEFRTVEYTLAISVTDETLSYEADTVMQLKNRAELFHHTDRNVLRRTA
jgi:hypothetical protein